MPSTNSNTTETKDVEKVSTVGNTQNKETIDNDSIGQLKKELAALKTEKIKNDAQLKQVQIELKEANLKVEKAQLEYDILEKAAELLKKEKGINIESLTNKEKAIQC